MAEVEALLAVLVVVAAAAVAVVASDEEISTRRDCTMSRESHSPPELLHS